MKNARVADVKASPLGGADRYRPNHKRTLMVGEAALGREVADSNAAEHHDLPWSGSALLP